MGSSTTCRVVTRTRPGLSGPCPSVRTVTARELSRVSPKDTSADTHSGENSEALSTRNGTEKSSGCPSTAVLLPVPNPSAAAVEAMHPRVLATRSRVLE